jgi:hypothetical protein
MRLKPALSYIYPTGFTKLAYGGAAAYQQRSNVSNLTPEQAARRMRNIKQTPTGGWVETQPQGSDLSQPSQQTPISEQEVQILQQKQQEYNQGLPQPAAKPQAETPNTTPATDPLADLAADEQTAPMAQSIQEMAQQLNEASLAFGKAYNEQIRVYNPAIQQIKRTVQQLVNQPGINMSNPVMGQIQELIKVLRDSSAEESRDTQVVTQVANLANSINQSLGGAGGAPAGGAPAGGAPAGGAPAGGAPAPAGPKGKGWGSGIGNFLGNLRNIPGNIGRGFQQSRQPTANSIRPILTAGMSSAVRIVGLK